MASKDATNGRDSGVALQPGSFKPRTHDLRGILLAEVYVLGTTTCSAWSLSVSSSTSRSGPDVLLGATEGASSSSTGGGSGSCGYGGRVGVSRQPKGTTSVPLSSDEHGRAPEYGG